MFIYRVKNVILVRKPKIVAKNVQNNAFIIEGFYKKKVKNM